MKKRLSVKEVTFVVQENSGDLWYEEINNWIFHSSFANRNQHFSKNENKLL